jgi:hypothetical protein
MPKKNKVVPISSTTSKKDVSTKTTNSKSQPQKKTSNEKTSTKVEEVKVESKEAEKEENIVPETKLSEEESNRHNAARKIQCSWRMHNAKLQLKKLKEEKKNLDEKLSKLEQDAYIQMIKMEQEREEKKRLKKLKEMEMKKKRENRRKKFMEAAYDGNLQELKFLINDLEKELETAQRDDKSIDEAKKKQAIIMLIDCKDSNNNTALSEAAAGGSAEVCKFLLTNNADPNSRGAFGRTPLWRSAFAGHLNCVQVLLENGADPRIYSTDGQRCVDAATQDNVKNLLDNWNIQLTMRMLEQIEKTRRELKQEQIASLESRKEEAEKEYLRITSQYELTKLELLKCNQELQRLHDEYLLNEHMYAPLIEKKESEKVDIQLRYEALREKSFKARINFKDLLAEFKKEKRTLTKDDSQNGANQANESDNESSDNEQDESNVTRINIKEMDDMILRDLSNFVRNAEKWPIIIDQNEQATTFLRYRDTNYVNCLDIQLMQPDRFRLALIGSIRYGKPFVLDLMQYDNELIESIKATCEQIDSTLFTELFNKKLIENERFMHLVRPEKDGKEYEIQNFNATRIKNFKVLVLTSNPYPCEKVLSLTTQVKIISSSKSNKDDLDF